MTSPLRPPIPPAAQIRQNSGHKYVNEEVCIYIRTLKPLKTRKEKEELKCKRPGSTNCRNHSDVIVSGVIATASIGDITTRDINKPIARKRYAPRKQSLLHSKGIIKSSLRVCSRTFTKITLLLAIVISVFGGLFNIRLPERKSTTGTSSSLFPSESLSFHDSLFLSILRESSATIIGINERLCSCINKGTFLNNNKQLIGRMEVLHNTIIREERGYMYHGYAMYALATFPAGNVCAGKHLDIYIFRSTKFCTFHDDYLDIYIVNLDSSDKFTVFYNLIYLYIYILFTVHGHPAAGQHTLRLFSFIYIYCGLFFLKSNYFDDKKSL